MFTSDTSVVKQPVIPSNIAAIAATAKNSFFIIVFVYLVDYILTALLYDYFVVRPLRCLTDLVSELYISLSREVGTFSVSGLSASAVG